MKYKTRINITAIHEASHMVMYLQNCIELSKLPRISEIYINYDGETGKIVTRNENPPAYCSLFLASDLDAEVKMRFKKEVIYREIKLLISGFAGEAIRRRLTLGIALNLCLTKVYKNTRMLPESDFFSATEYGKVLGLVNKEIDTPDISNIFWLVDITKEVIADLKKNWEVVLLIAKILDREKRIEGYDLKCLVEEAYNQISNNAASIN